MIATVHGQLQTKTPERVVVDVKGIGLDVIIPLSTYYALPDTGEKVFLFTLLIVREDSLRLFGFFTEPELEMFKVLIDVSRIGPKLALVILSSVTASDLHNAVIQQDFNVLIAIPGIGKKTAERLLFEVRDKLEQLGKIQSSELAGGSKGKGAVGAEVVGILVNLGYRQKDAERAVDMSISSNEETLSVDDMIRFALKLLAGR
ncbi:Holliday junction branch migration protein RuvA [bacterium]|nr:Holliday junction branch migration protein RuvA [bacterium]